MTRNLDGEALRWPAGGDSQSRDDGDSLDSTPNVPLMSF